MKVWRLAVCVVGLLMAVCGGNVALAAGKTSNASIAPDEQVEIALRTAASEQNAAADQVKLAPADVMPVQVVAPDDTELDTMLKYGTRVVIPEGTRYYASADGGGSGPYGTMGGRYAPMGADYYIGGFSSLTGDAERLKNWSAYNPEYVPVAEEWSDKAEEAWDDIWVVIFRDTKDERPLGWLPTRLIAVVNGILGDGGSNAAYENGVEIIEKDLNAEGDGKPSKIDSGLADAVLQNPTGVGPEIIDKVLPDPGNRIEELIQAQDNPDSVTTPDAGVSEPPFVSTREIAYAIEDYADDGEKVAFLMDASGSVADYMVDIANYGNYVDKVNKADVIITFAMDYAIIAAEDYLTTSVNNMRTDMYTPLNELEDVAEYDRIIIVTDTFHNVRYVSVEEVPEFAGKIVMVCPNSLDKVDTDVIRKVERAFNTTVYLCQLNNELERIQVLEMAGESR